MVSETRSTEISRAQANGSGTDQTANGYYTIFKSGWDFIGDLLTLVSKSDNSQAVFGAGRSLSSNSAAIGVGSLKAKPAFCGYSNGTSDVKVFYIPATSLASENGFPTLANMIIVGKVLKEIGDYDEASIEATLKKVISAKHANMLEVNKKAMKLGAEY